MLRILGPGGPWLRSGSFRCGSRGGAAEEIAAAIRWANLHQAADLIITGRGGGSMEDLWAFNEECVARAVYGSQIPVISAVGHEPDATIADFTADLRAATPSNAAALAVPDQNEIYAALASLGARMEQASRQRLLRERQRLERLRRAGSWPIHGAIFRRSVCCWTIRAAAWATACLPAYPVSGSALPDWPPRWTPSAL